MLFVERNHFSFPRREIEMGNIASDTKNPKESDLKSDEIKRGRRNGSSLSTCKTRNKRSSESSGKSPTNSLEKKGHSKRICTDEDNGSRRKLEGVKKIEKVPYLKKFFKLFDDDVIQDFLWNDGCAKISDNYLLSMVYVYFRRAELTTKEYTRFNFFAALFLAHDMEEDDEEFKHEIFPWALGASWSSKYPTLVARRDSLLKRMKFRCAVSSLTCQEVMALCPSHPIWQRERQCYHGGASRLYPPDDEEPFRPKGPDGSPVFCGPCKIKALQVIKPLKTRSGNILTNKTQNQSLLASSKTSHTAPGFNSREE